MCLSEKSLYNILKQKNTYISEIESMRDILSFWYNATIYCIYLE